MHHLELFGSCLKLTGIICVKPLDFTPPGKPLEGPARLNVPLVAHGDAGNQGRINVLDVYGVLPLVDAVFLAAFVCHQVVCCNQLAPLFRTPLKGAFIVASVVHFTVAACVAEAVEWLMS